MMDINADEPFFSRFFDGFGIWNKDLGKKASISREFPLPKTFKKNRENVLISQCKTSTLNTQFTHFRAEIFAILFTCLYFFLKWCLNNFFYLPYKLQFFLFFPNV